MYCITPIPAFQDNYIWAIHDDRSAAVVDPGDATPVQQFLTQHRLTLCAIVNTHHHGDHVGGNSALLAQHRVPVFGPAHERIPGVTRRLCEGDRITLPEFGLELSVLDVPGHTAGHIAYFGGGHLFCGDTLFSSGCGRLFEGTAQQMHASLGKLAALAPETRVYCAHEYTAANIRFAKLVEPGNPELLARENEVARVRAESRPSLPSTMAGELRFNPFLRCGVEQVRTSAENYAGQRLAEPADVFAALRQWKNNA